MLDQVISGCQVMSGYVRLGQVIHVIYCYARLPQIISGYFSIVQIMSC